LDTSLRVKRVPIDSVHPDPANVRLHDERNLASIKGSLARFGQQKPIVVDKRGTIRAGNGTYQAACALGWKEIEVVESELEGPEAVAYAIADNRTSDLSSFDDEALAKLLIELRNEEQMVGTGFDEADLEKLLMELGQDLDGIQQDEAPLAPEDPVTKRGDLWVLGRHRLLCGDSSLPEDVDRLLAGAPIHLVNTDPPYNVKVEPRSNNAIAAGLSSFTSTHHQGLDVARHPGKAKPTHERLRAKDRPLANDFLPEEEFDRLLRAWFGNMSRVLLPGRSFYIWGGYANLANYPPALRENALYFSQAIVWDKQHPVLTRKDFMGAFEIAFYGWKEGAGHEFFGPANITDLWAVKKVNPQSMVHLTEKPVELAVRALQYSSKRGENVLDLFGGSGSTLMACEQIERSAFLVELDPAYCDVIVERWQKATSQKATLETGQTFEAAVAERRSA